MRSIRQLLRQPLKTLLGIGLVTLAVAVLCISLGQSMAAEKMERELETKFITTALATDKYQYYEESAYSKAFQTEYTKRTIHLNKPDEITEIMLSLADQYPDMVESVQQPGLATAYIPTLTAANFTEFVSTSVGMGLDGTLFSIMTDTAPFGAPYTQIAAQITLTEIGQPETYLYVRDFNGTAAMEALRRVNGLEYMSYYESSFTPEELEQAHAISVILTGTIDRVLGLQEGYADPTGFTARMTLILPDQAALDALELQTGSQYLVYGMDYYDNDWELRNLIFSEAYGIVSQEFGDAVSATSIDAFDPENLHMLDQEQIDSYTWFYRHSNGGEYPSAYQVAYYLHEQVTEDGSSITRCINLTNRDMMDYRAASFSLFDLSALLADVDERYAVPTIAELEGSAEDFLASSDGILWQKALTGLNISNHSFAIIGTENLSAVACFSNQSAWISQGRGFTDAEIADGARVCVISEHLAELNSLSVGDTIPVQYLRYDWDSPYQNFLSDGYGITNPGGYFYSAEAGFAGDAEEYTIVGLYDKDYLWPNAAGTLYGITPNTIFVPKSSVTGDMDHAVQGLFYSAVLKNGSQEEFEALMKGLGEEGLFLVDDQGYAEVHDSLHDYQVVAKQALAVGALVYSVISMLFLFLFPGMQGKALATMGSLGASRREKLRHMALSAMGILVPGSVLGLAVGCLLWQQVVGQLMRSARVVLTLELDWLSLMLICLGQLALSVLLAFLVSIPLTREKGMKNSHSIRRLFRNPSASRKGWSAVLFALIIALVLCGLNAANESELADYETAYHSTPVKVTLMTTKNQSAYDLGAYGHITDLFTIERFARFTPLGYLKNLQFMCNLTPAYINSRLLTNQIHFSGMTSEANPPDLSDQKECQITWEEGFGYWVFDEVETMYVLLPENHGLSDYAPDTPGFQIMVGFTNSIMVGYKDSSYGSQQGEPLYEFLCHEVIATVAGTYTNSVAANTAYCSFQPLQNAAAIIQQSLALDHISGTLISNDEADDLREMASQWFADPSDSSTFMGRNYAMDIDTGVLDNLKTTLENSMTVNRICTMLVFLLSTGAGFFLGFLMIRSRKREIILMRTLGKPNVWIFRDLAWEQMRCILLGTALGGGAFRWQPLGKLGLFVLLYFAGLSLALAVFLNSKLLTTMKEDE